MSGLFRRRLAAQRRPMVALTVLAALVLLSLAAPLLAPQDPGDPVGFDPQDANHPPALSWTFLLGADDRGRSVVALLLWGGRASLAIGLGAAIVAAVVGVSLGALAARYGAADLVVGSAMDLCQAMPPLLVALALGTHLGGLEPALLIAAFAASGWAASARLTRAAVAAGLHAPSTEAARAVGVSGLRLFRVHLLPDVLAPVAAWSASAAASYLALAAGLDFLGLGLPSGSISWGTALAGAQDALALGNWWWLAAGGISLAVEVLALHAIAQGMGRAGDPAYHLTPAKGLPAWPEPPTAVERRKILSRDFRDDRKWQRRGRLRSRGLHGRRHAGPRGAGPLVAISAEPEAQGGVYPREWELWAERATTGGRAGRRLPGWAALPVTAAVVISGLAAGLVLQSRHHGSALPDALPIAERAVSYDQPGGHAPSYIATASYAATEASVAGRPLPWAAWGECPPDLGRGRCAHVEVQLWYSGTQARAFGEGITFVCTAQQRWGINPMAGLAIADRRGCGPLGPGMGEIGSTAGVVATLLPAIVPQRARSLGAELVAGRRCWLLALGGDGRACVDAATGLTLALERLDHTGQPAAAFRIDALSYGLDLAPELFSNPIPGGNAGLMDSLSQPLLNIQAADDQALFSALVPTVLPAGLTPQTPTFDSFYDDRRGYALTQRVRQAYSDRRGKVALVLIETVPRSAWDVTPPRAQAQGLGRGDRRVLIWQGQRGLPSLVRMEYDGTAALISSAVLSPPTLARVAMGLE
jgi:peptide/nickel transport system permease protein